MTEILDPHTGDEIATGATHVVENQPPPLVGHNTYLTDTALREAVAREGAAWAEDRLVDIGQRTGEADYIRLGFQANAVTPTLTTHDRYGRRVDEIDYHPAYHQLMATSVAWGLHASPWADPKPGAHVARAAAYYLQAQVEAAHGCPITMTFAAVPTIRHQPELAEWWLPRVEATVYDPRNVPADEKPGLTIGMAMTEKQGGSDVRRNTTRAVPVGAAGPGEEYELVGHKYFVSAPMCDAFLVLAQAPGGLSCFLLPRWRPDGSKNQLEIQQLKDKMGNVANASGETELRGALAWMVGEEGRGVRTIIEMVAMTRFDCMIGSSAGMRQAVAQATHHAAHREAFGARLIDKPLMSNLLADLALEAEASLALTMRVARALDRRGDDEFEAAFSRLATPVGKYWICKRTPHHAYESLEVIGGMGVMETTIMPRLFRESPINSVWEGSGNVQCLDVLRAIGRDPSVLEAVRAEIGEASGADRCFDRFVAQLDTRIAGLLASSADELEYGARDLTDRLALALQASLLLRHAPAAVGDAFCAGRLDRDASLNLGTLPAAIDTTAITTRALPA